MGRKAAAETVSKVLVAFIERNTWSQADLARHCGSDVRTVRACLQELVRAQVPLSDQDDHPHVYWTIRHGYFDRVEFQGVDLASIVRLIARLPKSNTRDAVLRKLTTRAFGIQVAPNTAELSAAEGHLTELEDHRTRRVATRITYRSASTGKSASRCVSVQHIQYESPPRFVGHCHDANALKWFRLDRVTRVSATSDRYVPSGDVEVQRFVGAGLDGYVGPRRVVECTFVVTDPDARWASENLPHGGRAQITDTPDGKRITMQTSAIEVLARFIVGLGKHARVERPPALRDAVRDLAQGALLNADPVSAISSTKIAPVKRSTVTTVAAVPKRKPNKR